MEIFKLHSCVHGLLHVCDLSYQILMSKDRLIEYITHSKHVNYEYAIIQCPYILYTN